MKGKSSLPSRAPHFVEPLEPRRMLSVTVPAPPSARIGGSLLAAVMAARPAGRWVAQPAVLSTRPVILSTNSGQRAHAIALTWTDVTAETGYRVERSSDGGATWTLVAQLPANITSYFDQGLLDNTAYRYRVGAFDANVTIYSDTRDVRTASFTMFDATNFPGVTHPLAPNLSAQIRVVNTGFWDVTGTIPDETGTRAVARSAADAGKMLVFDIERWPFLVSQSGQQQVDQSIAKEIQLITWAHDERPNLKVGIYDDLPLAATPSDVSYVLSRLGPVVDFICQDHYTFDDNNYPAGAAVPTWVSGMQAAETAAQLYHKPIYAFVMPNYMNFLGLPFTPMSADRWRFELAELRPLVDGVVVWTDGAEPFDAQAPWWPATQSFLARSPLDPAPLAPAISLAALGAQLSWAAPPAGSAAHTDGYEIQRSADGGATYASIGYAMAGDTSWADSTLIGGSDSYYRVRAVGAFGDSGWSNVVHDVVTRSAFAITQATLHELGFGVINVGGAVSRLSASYYLGFKSVDFGADPSTAANQFVADIATPYLAAGMGLELHLDAANGPVIGTRTLAGTGTTYAQAAAQSIPLTATVTGVHDLYLVVLASADGTKHDGAGNLFSIQFSRNAPPAAPRQLIANSTGAAVNLTWISESADQSGFLIERSADGGQTFTPLVTVPAGASSYADASAAPGVTYTYRVRAASAFGNSDPTNVASGSVGLRSAFGTIQAGSLDAVWGVSVLPGGILSSLDNGDWAGWYHVDFGTVLQPLQFTARIGVGTGAEGQFIDIHLDDPSGPLIGTLTTQDTGNYGAMQLQSTAVSPVTGVHDLYLVFRGAYGIANMDWFRFST